MKSRGRPKSPDVLTPREQEVLSLIREGLSNRDIAVRLEISLAGAKFHVSEIIGKLGVSSREEAAIWQPEQRRGLLPWQGALLARVVGAGLLIGVAIVVFVFATLGWGKDRTNSSQTALTGTPTPTSEQLSDPNWLLAHPQMFRSLQDAAKEASFQPQLPTYVPAGYQIASIEFIRFPTIPPGLKEVHNDSITVIYNNPKGNVLVVSQGFPARPGAGFYEYAPAGKKGTLDLAGREAYWVKGAAYSSIGQPGDTKTLWPIPRLPDGGLLLAWNAGRYGAGWAANPTHPDIKYAGSPFDYGIASDVLSLDELTRIALSVPFIADPSLTP